LATTTSSQLSDPSSDEDSSSDEEIDLSAPRFHTVVQHSSRHRAALAHSTKVLVATHTEKRSIQPVTATPKVASVSRMKRRRPWELETSSDLDSSIPDLKKSKKGRKTPRKVLYDSDEEIEERDETIRNLFLRHL